MHNVAITLDLDNLNDAQSGRPTPDTEKMMETWVETEWVIQHGLDAIQREKVNVVAEKFGTVSKDSFNGDGVADYDANNRFKLTRSADGTLGLLHQYRESAAAEFEAPTKLFWVGGVFYLFPTLNDYGVDDIFLSVVELVD